MIDIKLIALRTALKVLHGSGVTALQRKRLQGMGSIFCLHQVCPGGGLQQGFSPNSKLEITPEFLRRLINLVRKRGFEPVSLSVMVERLKAGRVSGKPMAVFTLDDGYLDNLIYAKPIFDELECPYTIFVSPSIADGTCNIWWRTLEQILAKTEHLRFSSGTRKFDLRCQTMQQKNRAFELLFWHFAEIDEREQRRQLDGLAGQFSIDHQAYCKSVAMNWDQLRNIAQSPLCTIGSHTVNHFLLKALSAEEALVEMVDSKLRIEKELNRKIEFFAFPYGNNRAAGPREFALAEKAGYTAAVTTRKGVIRSADGKYMQSLPRIMISGRFQEEAFIDALISGLPTGLLNTVRPVHKG